MEEENQHSGTKMIRDDLSNKLIHFTKGTVRKASMNIYSILLEKKLIGGSRDIKGGFKCICFTESPIGKFSYVLANPKLFEFPYAPLGIMVDKIWLFRQGGRPVIYQPDGEYELLDDSQKYRHKIYEPEKNIDYTWEREWRIHKKELVFDPMDITIIVPKREWVEKFKSDYFSSIRSQALIFKKDAWLHIQKFPWHFIVLEDLGISIDWGKNVE